MEIYQDGREIGTLHIEKEGLYARITCKTEPSREIRRIYLAYPFDAEYLGIPDQKGNLTKRIAQKHLPQSFHAVASKHPKEPWVPWRGEVDGVLVESALIRPQQLAMPLSEALKFPEWDMQSVEIYDVEMALLPLNADGTPQPIEREVVENEALDLDNVDFGMSADEPSDDGIGGEGWEADCTDL